MVTRSVDTTMLSALSDVFSPVILVYVDWPTAPVRVHSGVGDITFDGETWSGLGKYGDIIIPQEQASIVPEAAELIVSGTIADLLVELNKDPRNKDVKIYFGVTTEPAGNTLVGTPALLFTGYVDSVRFNLDRSGQYSATSNVTIGVASGPSARTSASITHSAEDQKFLYPTDTAGEKIINADKRNYNPDQWPEP